MGDATADPALFASEWVHLFERDGSDGAVFVPSGGDIPLSRRPRARLRLRPDGSATLRRGGSDDRPIDHPARWERDAGEIVVYDADGHVAMRIVAHAPGRLLVRLQ